MRLISQGLLGRPCEMRHKQSPHKTNANSFLDPQGGGDLLYPSLTCMGVGRMEGPQLSQSRTHPVTLGRQLYMMNPQERWGCPRLGCRQGHQAAGL